MITPPVVDAELVKFAETIVASPKMVRIRLAPGPLSTSCSANVRNAISECGGLLLKGWRIWLLPGKLLQAEAHSVWEAPNGVIADVTPTGEGDSETVFFEDPNMAESPGDDFIHSRRKNVCGHPIVDEYIKLIRDANEWWDKQIHGVLALPDFPDQDLVEELERKLYALKIDPEAATKGEEADV